MQKVINIFNACHFRAKESVYSSPLQPYPPIWHFSFSFHQSIFTSFLFFCLKSFGVVPVFVTSCWHLLQMSTWWPNRSHTRSVANVPMWPRQAGTGECLLAPLYFIISSLVHLFLSISKGMLTNLHAAFPFSTHIRIEKKGFMRYGNLVSLK